MIVLDEPWVWWGFIHLTDRADDGTIALYDDTVAPVEDGCRRASSSCPTTR